jgi:F-type H+-transporting ATPase subunit epsilon
MTLQIELVSAEARVWSGEARQIIARTTEGDMGILTGHAPTLAVLAAGQVRITSSSGESVVADVEGGFLSVDHDRVTVVSDTATVVSGSGN